jgi:hypothetical protein
LIRYNICPEEEEEEEQVTLLLFLGARNSILHHKGEKGLFPIFGSRNFPPCFSGMKGENEKRKSFQWFLPPKKILGVKVKIKAKMNFWINFGLGGVFGSQKWISALGKFTPKETGISLCSTTLMGCVFRSDSSKKYEGSSP